MIPNTAKLPTLAAVILLSALLLPCVSGYAQILQQTDTLSAGTDADYSFSISEDILKEASPSKKPLYLTVSVNATAVTESCQGGNCNTPAALRLYGRQGQRVDLSNLLYDSKDANGYSVTPNANYILYEIVWNPCEVQSSEYFFKIFSEEGKTQYTVTVSLIEDIKYPTVCTSQDHSSPQPREFHSFLNYNGKLYLFGGRSPSGDYLNDFWLMDEHKPMWREIMAVGSLEDASGDVESRSLDYQRSAGYPRARAGHCGFFYYRFMVIFGGISSKGQLLNDLWLFDTVEMVWFEIDVGGDWPSPRAHLGGTAVTPEGVAYFVGGKTDTGVSSEVWALNLLGILDQQYLRWEEINVSGASVERYGHQCFNVDNDTILLFGGLDGSQGPRNDVWEFNLSSKSWSQVAKESVGPAPRGFYAADLIGNVLIVFGGLTASGTLVGDGWFYNVDTQVWYQYYEPELEIFEDRLLSRSGAKVVYADSVQHPVLYGGQTKNGQFPRSMLRLEIQPCSLASHMAKAQCYPCPEGSYLSKGNCEPCGKGHYGKSNFEHFETQCYACPSGTFGPAIRGTGIHDCLLCPYGTSSGNEGAESCPACEDPKLCPIGSISQMNKNWNELASLVEHGNKPILYHTKTSSIREWEKWVAVVGLIFLVAFLIIVIIALKNCRQATVGLLTSADIHPITGGTKNHYLGGILTITYFVILGLLSFGSTIKYLFYNEYFEIAPLMTDAIPQGISSTFLIGTELVGYHGSCTVSADDRDITVSDGNSERKITTNCQNQFEIQLQNYLNEDSQIALNCSETGSYYENTCRVEFSCAGCNPSSTNRTTYRLNIRDASNYVQMFKWDFKSFWSDDGLEEINPDYSLAESILSPVDNKNPDVKLAFKGGASSSINLSLTPTFYSDDIRSYTNAGFRVQYNSNKVGGSINQSNIDTSYATSLQFSTDLVGTHFQVRVLPMKTLLEYLAELMALMAGLSFLMRLFKHAAIDSEMKWCTSCREVESHSEFKDELEMGNHSAGSAHTTTGLRRREEVKE